MKLLVPVAARSNAYVCGRSPAEIVGLNPTRVCCECCVSSGRGLCNEPITCPEESYRLWCIVVFDLETSRMRRPWPMLGRSATEKKTNGTLFFVYCTFRLYAFGSCTYKHGAVITVFYVIKMKREVIAMYSDMSVMWLTYRCLSTWYRSTLLSLSHVGMSLKIVCHWRSAPEVAKSTVMRK